MIYWDSNSTSKLRPVALEAASKFLLENRSLNPSSIHQEGRAARGILRNARESILSFLFPEIMLDKIPGKLVFVSGGSEACNSLINGFLNFEFLKSEHIVCSGIEHAAMIESVKKFQSLGVKVNFVTAKPNGIVGFDEILNHVTERTSIVSLMLSNNETGRGQDLLDLAKNIKRNFPQAVLVSDISQAVSKTNLDLAEIFDSGVDAVAVSAHKIGALGGIGAVIFNLNSNCRLFNPLILGGGQEDKLRGGTEFLFGAHVFGETCKFLQNHRDEVTRRRNLKQYLARQILEETPELEVMFQNEISHQFDLCNTLYISTKKANIRADDFVVALDIEGLLVSTGSACSSGRQDVSHVPLAMGFSKDDSRNFFRLSLDWDVSESDLEAGIEIIKKVLIRSKT